MSELVTSRHLQVVGDAVAPAPTASKGRAIGSSWRRVGRRLRRDPVTVLALTFIAVELFVAVFAPLVAPANPNAQDLLSKLQSPSGAHWLGTDQFGRDQLSRLVFGARTSLLASGQAVGISLVAGVPLGLVAGYYGGRIDGALNRFSDALMSVPALVLALTVVAVLGPGLNSAMFGVGLVLMPRIFRIMRAATKDVAKETFVEASRALGCRPRRTLWRHIFPNAISPVIVQVSLTLGTAMLAEASLSFLGLGVRPPTASWGSMLGTASSTFYAHPDQIIAPGVAIMVTVLAFSIVGDALRDALVTSRRAEGTA